MNLKTWNAMQLAEADSSINRYYFWQKYQREPKDFDELLMFYIEDGGAKDFATKHKGELNANETSPAL